MSLDNELWRQNKGLIVRRGLFVLQIHRPMRFNIEKGELVSVPALLDEVINPAYHAAQVERSVAFNGDRLEWITYRRCPTEEEVMGLLSEPVRHYAD